MNNLLTLEKIKKDIEVSISHLQTIIVDYLGRDDHNGFLRTGLKDLETAILRDYYKVCQDEKGAGTEAGADGEFEFPDFLNKEKKTVIN